jgi:hypothetical protein
MHPIWGMLGSIHARSAGENGAQTYPSPPWSWAWTRLSPKWGWVWSRPGPIVGLDLGVDAPGPDHGTGWGCVQAQHRVGGGCTPTQLGVEHPKRHNLILSNDFRALSLKWGWVEKPWTFNIQNHKILKDTTKSKSQLSHKLLGIKNKKKEEKTSQLQREYFVLVCARGDEEKKSWRENQFFYVY